MPTTEERVNELDRKVAELDAQLRDGDGNVINVGTAAEVEQAKRTAKEAKQAVQKVDIQLARLRARSFRT